MSEEWLEIRARSREDAVAAAVAELGLDSAKQVNVEVVEEPQKGLLGFGGKDGLFRVSKARSSSRRRRRGGGSSSGSSKGGSSGGKGGGKQSRDGSSESQGRRDGNRNGNRSGNRNGDRQQRGSRQDGRSRSGGSGKTKAESSRQAPKPKEPRKEEEADMPDLSEQATVVNDFLVGLLEAFGLEGDVETSVKDDDIIIANVTGEQAEALIGPKGQILQAILELTRTVVQRKTQAGARIRLDIGGYTERRREALRIYAGRLAEQVVEDGEEVMLEPMNPADRKVVHDVVAEIDGVRSYSEGEEPRRSVVISPSPTD
ncbi:MAG: Jag N-terminal domain-containing protein [Actinobacteria bacterium]|nr:Jag N-terminal domain-containing protein [Actinomycetota bacterium]